MTAALSIIVPTLNAASTLPACLEPLMEGVLTGLVRDLVVTDEDSGDETLTIADAAGATMVKGTASRGGQLRRGVEAAQGEWFLILHADTVLEPGWSAVAAEHIQNRAGAGYFSLAFDQRGVMPGWTAGWANFRSRVFALPYGDQGLLVSRSDYERAGGYPDQPLMEDVHLVRALPCPLVALNAVAVTSAGGYRQSGWLRRGTRNLWTLARYFAGTDPARLADGYRR